MKELELAEELHRELDGDYARRMFRAIKLGHRKAEASYAERRRINDAAYVLVVFGTFERAVTERAEIAVKMRAKRPAFQARRAWETLLNGNELTANFLNRVRVVLDQQSQEFAKVQQYYKVRNDLAHEGITTKKFSITAVVSDLQLALRCMKK